MKALIQQTKWQFILLARNQILTISVVVTFIYALVFFALQGLPKIDKVLTALIMNDPAVIGLLFIGAALIIEQREKVLSALFVAPMNLHVFLWSRVLALSIIGWLCALGMCVSAVGLDFHWVYFSLGTFGVCMICCLTGLLLVAYNFDFMKFILACVPVLLLFAGLPLLNDFGVTDWAIANIIPTQGSFNLIVNSYAETIVMSEVIWGMVSIVFWGGVIYGMTYRVFLKKVMKEI